MTYEPMPTDWQRALAVVAHPDDLEYGGAAAVARWTTEGRQVTYLLATRGEAGIDSLPPAECGPLREAEQRAAAAEVGVDVVEFLDHPDGLIEYGVPLRRDIAAGIRRHRPELVVTGNLHETWPGGVGRNMADHMAVGRAVLDAVRDAANRWLFPETGQPWGGVRWVAVAASPLSSHAVDVGEYFDRGVASLAAHAAYLAALGGAMAQPAAVPAADGGGGRRPAAGFPARHGVRADLDGLRPPPTPPGMSRHPQPLPRMRLIGAASPAPTLRSVNPSTMQAQVIVDELVRCGVIDAVLCPGSRNAPLSFALHAADLAGLLRLHVRIDERTAAFLALGLALRSRRPVPVCTTSGTAVANLHPAMLEASHAGVALLAITADRPPDAIGTGANQTILQPGIFGSAPRLAVNGGVAGSGPGENGRWRALVCRVVAAATGALGGAPGPVHLNLPFAEPLVPDGAPAGELAPGRPGGVPWTTVAPSGRSLSPLPLDPGLSTVVVAGSGAPPFDVAVPVIAEPVSAAWPAALRTGPWLLGAGLAELRPRQVIVAGRPTLHRPVQRLLADPEVSVYALADPGGAGWPDCAGTVRAVGSLPDLAPPAGWLDRWEAADRAASRALDRALDEPAAPAGLRLARTLVAALPVGAQLLLGSSNPVRDVALAAVPRPGLTILANRGVAGIDGTVSTAVGAALAHAGGPAYALLGDLTLLHDTTGLVIGPDEPRADLTIVVLNDRGGGIFGLLEQGGPEHAAAFERVFGTTHAVDLRALCAAMGVEHVLCDDAAAITAALEPAAGLRMVEVRAERGGLREGHARLRERILATLRVELGCE